MLHIKSIFVKYILQKTKNIVKYIYQNKFVLEVDIHKAVIKYPFLFT